MTAPTAKVRAAVYERDGHACVVCNRTSPLSFQHRRAVGMGGSKIKPHPEDGLTMCVTCNVGCEQGMQSAALKYGWKVPRWVSDPSMVPVWVGADMSWYALEGVSRRRIDRGEAQRMRETVYGPQEAV